MNRARIRSVLLVAGAVIGCCLPASDAEAIAARAVATGDEFTCAITAQGGVKCWGVNQRGQLGNGSTTPAYEATDVVGLSNVVGLSAGADHACAVLGSGAVKCWGRNAYGQLGDGTTINRSTPVAVLLDGVTVTDVAAGYCFTCAITTGGGVKCWGDNSMGQLGDGTTASHPVPGDVTGLTTGAMSVTVGVGHTCAVTAAGGVKCWGYNNSGQLGDGTIGTNRLTAVAVLGLAGVTSLSSGYYHTCALTQTGGVKCWGGNAYGQLGDGTTTSRLSPGDVAGLTSGATAIAAGPGHACALTATLVRCWGDNSFGELGDGTTTNRYTPVEVPATENVISLTANGHFPDAHTCALTWQGRVLCWGANLSGQVGQGGPASLKPVVVLGLPSSTAASSIGPYGGCAISSGGGLKCWGYNLSGLLGDGSTTSRTTAADVSSLVSGVASVSVGRDHTCAVTTSGAVKCWGLNSFGQLGDATTTTRLVPTNVTGLTSGVAAVAAGRHHTCALGSDGTVQCWGMNSRGQLGDGSTSTSRTTPADVVGLGNVVSLAVSGDHSCAATASGAAYCWGANYDGQLGDGTLDSRLTPTLVSGLASGVAQVAASATTMSGTFSSCARMTNGTVRCWGNNDYGQLGNGSTVSSSTPVAVVGLTGVAAVSLGARHACARTTAGAVWCWGHNSSGQLGDGTVTSSSTPKALTVLPGSATAIAAAGSDEGGNTCALVEGRVFCWGDDRFGQLGSGRVLAATTALSVPRFGPLTGAEFDGDWKMDPAIYRPSTGTWFWLKSTTSNASYAYRGWGVQAQGDTPLSGDFDGDGVLDPTVFRPSAGTWFILESHARFTTWQNFGWGTTSDLIVAADYDGDSITDAAVYRPSNGTWYVRPSSNPSGQWSMVFGNSTDTPVPADYDGDTRADIAVYRASTGTWFFLLSSTGYRAMSYVGWGVQASGDLPVPADYDRDGKADITVFRPTNGTWFVKLSSTGGWTYAGWGQSGDTPMPADYDGDGAADLAVYRASTGQWFVQPSGGATQWSRMFGQAGDVPLRAGR